MAAIAGANEPHAIVKAVMAIALRMAAQTATAAGEEHEQVTQQQIEGHGLFIESRLLQRVDQHRSLSCHWLEKAAVCVWRVCLVPI
jgi:hypothetical protein